MLGNIVEICQEGRHLALHRGLMVVKEGDAECGSVALDTMEALILSARQVSLSRPVMAALAAHNVAIVICDDKYMPISMQTPYAANYEAGKRMRAQAVCPVPLGKQLWRTIVQEKVRNQGLVLAWHRPGHPMAEKLRRLAGTVRSGDTTNTEGQAARIYWHALFDAAFVRDPDRNDSNILFNYAYTVLRAAVARSLVGAGLHPAIGIFHCNRLNAFALADDCMEPLRPLADMVVLESLGSATGNQLTPAVKRSLAAMLTRTVQYDQTATPLYQAIHSMSLSLVKSFVRRKVCVQFPQMLIPETTCSAECE